LFVPLCIPSPAFVVDVSGGSTQTAGFTVFFADQESYVAAHLSVAPYQASSQGCIQCPSGTSSRLLQLRFNSDITAVDVRRCDYVVMATVDLSAYSSIPSKQMEFMQMSNVCMPNAFFITSDSGSDFEAVVFDWSNGFPIAQLSSYLGYVDHLCGDNK